jgi:hypothetical protein
MPNDAGKPQDLHSLQSVFFFAHRERIGICHPEGRAFCGPKDLNLHTCPEASVEDQRGVSNHLRDVPIDASIPHELFGDKSSNGSTQAHSHRPSLSEARWPAAGERNADHLLEAGAAIRCNKLPAADWKIATLLDDPARLIRMRDVAKRLGKPAAAAAIAEDTLRLVD